VAFAAGGGGLVGDDDLGDGFTWPISLNAWEHRACAVAARNLSRAEWDRFAPEVPYAPVCP
jgi:hypothetical protein